MDKLQEITKLLENNMDKLFLHLTQYLYKIKRKKQKKLKMQRTKLMKIINKYINLIWRNQQN